MKIKSIRYKSPPFGWKILGWILYPFALILGILAFILVIPVLVYDFIKEQFFGIKPKPIDYKSKYTEEILLDNEDFKLVKINEEFFSKEEYDGLKWLDDYLVGLNDNDDYLIYKIADRKNETDLGNSYITHFKIETDTHLYLQKIFQENTETKNCIISFEKKTGKVEVIKEIGQYILEHYNEKTKTITGYGKEKVIHITLE